MLYPLSYGRKRFATVSVTVIVVCFALLVANKRVHKKVGDARLQFFAKPPTRPQRFQTFTSGCAYACQN